MASIRNAVTGGRNLIVVNDADLRPLVRLLIEIEFPEIPVLSERELQTELEFKAVQVIEPDLTFGDSESPLATGSSVRTEMVETVTDEASRTEPQITVQVNQHFLDNQSPVDAQGLEQTLTLMRDGLFYELGVMTPEVKVIANNALKPNQIRFRINGIESTVIEGLQPTEFFVNDSAERLSLLGVTGKETLNPANGNQAAIVENSSICSIF